MNDPSPYQNVVATHQQELLRVAATARLARQAGQRGSSWALWRRGTLKARRIGQLIHETTEETRELRLVEVKRA
jgi:hypothetical protein